MPTSEAQHLPGESRSSSTKNGGASSASDAGGACDARNASDARKASDVLIVGGGLVGLATAWQLQNRDPALRITVLEKEADVGLHQSSRNSGVLHSGIYYRPGSQKAQNCVAGREEMVEFCRRHDIPHEVCGKVIVACNDAELPRLDQLLERGQANGVRCERIGPERLQELEPHAAGIAALHVQDAGIVDFKAVVQRLRQLVMDRQGVVVTSAEVRRIEQRPDELMFSSTAGEFRARSAINCAGLHSDRVLRMAGGRSSARIVSVRGEYYRLRETARPLCQNLIYPVPDPRLPFLGIHLTRMMNGDVEVGPNAVLAFAREGYRRRDISVGDCMRILVWRGFRRFLGRYWQQGVRELRRSFSKRAFLNSAQQLVPDLRRIDLELAPAGVRAQAIGDDGRPVDDFLIERQKRFIHVLNAPSPAATASLRIGSQISQMLQDMQC